jgi:hypothetical protein
MATASTMMMEEKIGSPLSASARPFHPYCFYEPVTVAIYNEGVPTMAPVAVSQTLHGIQDEALDEAFPPDAQEAAELEAVEIFVEMMAQLSLLEDLEERARLDFSHIKKRWEARRKEGLKTRPRSPKHMVDRNEHKTQTKSSFSSQCRSLVPYSHHHKSLHPQATRRNDAVAKKLPVNTPATQRPTIQQPRKQG